LALKGLSHFGLWQLPDTLTELITNQLIKQIKVYSHIKIRLRNTINKKDPTLMTIWNN